MSGREGAATDRGGAGLDRERVSRRDLLRRMVGRLAQAVGAESAPVMPAPVLRAPYVPYTSRPTEPREGQVKEEQV